MTLSLTQQHLLSYFNLVKVSSFKSTLEVLEEIISNLNLDKSPTSDQLTEEISIINKTLQKYDMEIVFIVDEITCEKVNVLVNTADNIISQKSKFYDENISQLFSKIVKDCVLSDEGKLSETHCLNLSSQVKMTKSAAQNVLEKLVADKWLVSRDDKISLGMRTIAELEQNMKQHYPDNIKNCSFCKLIVIQGYICSNCKIKCHFACLKKYFKFSKSKCVCPNCKEVWDDVHTVIEIEAEQQPEESSSSNCAPKKKKKKS